MENNRNFIKNFIILFSGNAISQIIPIILAPFLARFFSPEEFAIQGNFIALASLIAIIAGGRYDIAIILPKSEKKAVNLTLLAARITIAVSILSLTLIFFEGQIAKLYNNKSLSDYLILIPISILILGFNSIYNQWLTRSKEYKKIARIKIFLSLSLNLTTICFGVLNYGEKGLIWGWLIGTTVANIILFLTFRKSYNKELIDKRTIKGLAIEYKDFPMINSLHAFTDLFFSQFLLFAIITRGFGAVHLGLFYMMAKYLKAPVRLISGSVGQLYYREANEQLINKKSVSIIFRHSLKTTLFFAFPFLVVVLFFAPVIFKLYLGDQWESSGNYAQIMAFPIFLSFLTSPVSSTTILYRKQKTAFIISLIGYLISILALYYGIVNNYNFIESLKIYAIAQSLYYSTLLLWYYKLTHQVL